MKINFFITVLIIIFFPGGASFSDIKTTKHNLSTTGSGSYKANDETRICVFCHVPHGAEPAVPLWNHASTTQTFIPYNQAVSATLKSNPGQPDGSSKLCLSCHDGTIALGSTVSEGVIAGLSGALSGSSSIGTNLSGSHPVSFVYNNTLVAQRGELVDPSTLTGTVKLDKNSKLQCTSCHDPHDNSNEKFLVMSSTGGALCTTCHNKTGWSAALHSFVSTVAGSGCNACHGAHGSASIPLLKTAEPALCYSCHGAAGPGARNIESQFLGSSTISRPGGGYYTTINTHHDVSAADHTYSGSKLTCSSCHNPHILQSSSGSSPTIKSLVDPFSRNTFWTGAGAATNKLSKINFCLSCHSGTFPPSVANPAQTISPTGLITNIGTTYLTDMHGDGSHRPNASNPAPAVARMPCTDCHGSHGSSYTDQAWNGNVYNLADRVNGTGYTDNGAGLRSGWPYIPPTRTTGQSKTVRVSPSKINTAGDANNLYNLCSACHSVTSGSSGASHMSIGLCSGCHYHGTSSGLL